MDIQSLLDVRKALEETENHGSLEVQGWVTLST